MSDRRPSVRSDASYARRDNRGDAPRDSRSDVRRDSRVAGGQRSAGASAGRTRLEWRFDVDEDARQLQASQEDLSQGVGQPRTLRGGGQPQPRRSVSQDRRASGGEDRPSAGRTKGASRPSARVQSDGGSQDGARRRGVLGAASLAKARTGGNEGAGRPASQVSRKGIGAGAEGKKSLRSAQPWTMRLALGGFTLIMALGLIVGLSFPLRPAVSQVENRTLTAFPEFTVEGVLNGSYFSQLSLWYSDTYPLREQLVQLNVALSGLFGVQTEQKLVGQDQKADDLPDEVAAPVDTSARRDVEVPTEQAMADEIQGNIMGRLYVEGDAAYSVYYFSQESVQQYATAISIAAERLDGQARVFSMVVPNNSAALLDEDTLGALGGTDQDHAIKYFYSLYDQRVNAVNVMDTLRANNDGYIYFRTDHHWTADGSYLAYVQFCKQAGWSPVDKGNLETVVFDPFLGTYYTQLGLPAMGANPDYVKAYYPNGTNELTYWTQDGYEVSGAVIQNVDGWADNSLYGTFVCGDVPLAHINNPEVTDGSSILLVKDSFGCAFAPWLVNNYQDVWILDFRYSRTNIVDFVREEGIDDVLFLNNIEIAGTTTVANMLTNLVSE